MYESISGIEIAQGVTLICDRRRPSQTAGSVTNEKGDLLELQCNFVDHNSSLLL